MKIFPKYRRFFNILLLILITGFLCFPGFSSGEDFEDITIEEISKYLELPPGKVEQLMGSLIHIFYSEWERLAASAYSTAEEMAVPMVMRQAVRVQALNHLLIDAPIEITKGIIKAAMDISKLFTTQGISILEEFEKESVKRAVSYGMEALFAKELKVTPGAIEFKYISRKKEEKRVILQYIVIYSPLGGEKGEVSIRFYSPYPLEPPINKGSIGHLTGLYTELTDDLPPFMVNIRGAVEDYKWISTPLIEISFPSEVPDLGIRPISTWEKYFLKPIENKIKEAQIIVTKATGESSAPTDLWNKINSFFSNLFSPAALVETSEDEIQSLIGEKTELLTVKEILEEEILDTSSEKFETYQPQKSEESEGAESQPQPLGVQEMSLEEMQEIIDDITEQLEIINQRIAKLAEIKSQQTEEEVLGVEDETEIEEEKEKIKEETEEEMEEETEENEKIKDSGEKEEVILCEKEGEPIRNKVIFNEIAWMGTENSANDEWIELRNISGQELDLTEWQILDKDNQIKIIFGRGVNLTIVRFSPRGEFLLLERTDDESVPGISADLVYSGVLNNSNETLYLFDENCQLQDKVEALPDWPGGDNSFKRTMERKSNLEWQTSSNIGGTPRAENSSGYYIISSGGGSGYTSPQESEEPAEETPSEEFPAYLYEILITEVQIRTATSANHDFVELYNPATSSIDISGLQLKKKTSSGNEYSIRVFPENSTMPAQDYFLWLNLDYASSTQISADAISSQTLAGNNSVALFDKDKNMIDAVAWGSSTDPFVENSSFPDNPEENQTLGRKWSTSTQNYIDTNNNQNDFEIQIPTPRAQNQTFIPEPEPEPGEEEEEEEEEESGPPLTVVINEIGWMGTATSSWDEWIELYNNNTASIDLAGWKIKKGDEVFITISTSTAATTTISDFYLLERDEKAINNIIADFVYGGQKRMSNDSCETLSLYNQLDQLIDQTTCREDEKWPAGKASPNYISMERIDSATTGATSTNWANNNLITRNGRDFDNNLINGTPGAENSVSKSETEISNANLDFNQFNEITLTYLGNPYIVLSTLTIPQNKTLSIKPNVILKFDSDAGLVVNGILKAEGEENKLVTFTNWESGRWRGIYFNSSQEKSELNYCSLNLTIGSADLPAIEVENSIIEFENSTLENFGTIGIKFVADVSINPTQNSSSTIYNSEFLSNNLSSYAVYIQRGHPTIKNSLFRGNLNGILVNTITNEDPLAPVIEGNNFEENEIPIKVSNANPILKNNKAEKSNNTINGILLHGHIYQNSPNFNLFKNDIPYVIKNGFGGFIQINEGVTLNIDPGVIVKFGSASYITIEGRMLAEGTGASPIVFTSLSDDYGGDTNNNGSSTMPGAGSWGGLTFRAPTEKSILKNVIVSYGGVWNPYWIEKGEVSVMESKIGIDGLTASYGSESGLHLYNSTSTVENSSFENNQVGLRIDGTDKIPQINNYYFADNEKCDFYWPYGGEECEAFKADPDLEVECGCCPY